MPSKLSALFTPAINEYQLDELVDILSDIRDFMGVKPECYFEQIEGMGLKVIGRITKMELREGQQVNASVTLKTASGNPAAYEKGTASWTTSDETVVQVGADPGGDELKAQIFGKNGADNTSVLITFTVDGDPDAGPDQKKDIVATLDVVCTQGEATVAEITTDTPTDSGPQINPLKKAAVAKHLK